MYLTGFYRFKRIIFTSLLFIILSSSVTASYATDSKAAVVVTIRPLYSLVSHLLEGIEQPALLMKHAQSPHHYNMRPSERRLLADAEAIIWIGPQMESHLTKIIQQQKKTKLIISAMQAGGLKLLNKRNAHNHENNHDKAVSGSAHLTADPHIWLSSHNAIVISRHIADKLTANDPVNADKYKKNLQLLTDRISQTRDFIRSTMKDSARPYIAYHDAFQYFDDEFGLNYIDAISHDEETSTSLKQLRLIRSHIQDNNIQCLVYQPPKPAIVDSLTGQTSVKAVALDPLGLDVREDKEAWFELMRQLAVNFQQCLTP